MEEASVSTVVSFNAIPAMLTNNVGASVGIQTWQDQSIGDSVNIAAGSAQVLDTVTVAVSEWACQSGTWQSTDCTTTPGSTFNVPITLTVWDSSGNVLGTVTQTFAIPYRPSADPTCTSAPADFKGADGQCYKGYVSTITFNLGPLGIVLNGSNINFDVSYNTKNYGPHPTGVAGPVDGLNIALNATTSTPAVGTYFAPGYLRENGASDNPGYYAGYNIMAQVTTLQVTP